MAKDIKKISVLISSPSDVAHLRQVAIEAIEDVNSLVGNDQGYLLAPLIWENLIRPNAGEEPQAYLNRVFGEFDIYLGVLGTKYGSETKDFHSGTEEEFATALERNSAGDCDVMFYFSQEQTDPHSLDLDQFGKVLDFKERIQKQGITTGSFTTPEDFKTKLTGNLVAAAKDVLDGSIPHKERSLTDVVLPADGDTNQAESATLNPLANLAAASDISSDDVGYLDLLYEMEEAFELLAAHSDKFTSELERLSARFNAATAKAEAVKGRPDHEVRKQMKLISDAVAHAMEDYVAAGSNLVPEIFSSGQTAVESSRKLMLSTASSSTTEDVIAARNATEETQTVIFTSAEQAHVFAETIAALPAPTSALAKQRRKSAALTFDVAAVLREIANSLGAVVTTIDDNKS